MLIPITLSMNVCKGENVLGVCFNFAVDSYLYSGNETDHIKQNPYSYCGGDPVNRVDPLGLDWYSYHDRKFLVYVQGYHGQSFVQNGTVFHWEGVDVYYTDVFGRKWYGDEVGKRWLTLPEVEVVEQDRSRRDYFNLWAGYISNRKGDDFVSESAASGQGDGVALKEKGPAFDGGFLDWANKINHLGKRVWNGKYIDDGGNVIGIAPITGTPPSFIGGPLRKGQSALKVGKYLFNPTAFHSVKEGVLAFANPKNFSHIVGSNPDLMFKGGKIWLTGTKTGGYFGKSYETGMTIADFLKLF